MLKQIIVTIHGIHTNRGEKNWQDKFASLIRFNNPEINVVSFKYGYVFAVLSWLASWAAGIDSRFHLWLWKKSTPSYTIQFVKLLKNLRANNPDAEISIVGHSFGTWITYEALEHLAHTGIDFKKVVMIAGIITCHLEYLALGDWLAHKHIQTIQAISSHNDFVVKNIALFPFGHLGVYGFVREGHAEDKVKMMQVVAQGIYNTDASPLDHDGVTDERLAEFYPKIIEGIPSLI